MRVIEVLKSARNTLSNPKNWIKDEFTNHHGGYCVRGALLNGFGYYQMDSTTEMNAVLPIQSAIETAIFESLSPAQIERGKQWLQEHHGGAFMEKPGSILAGVNNTGTHEEILDLLDTTIARQLVIDNMIANAKPAVDEPVVELRAALLVGV